MPLFLAILLWALLLATAASGVYWTIVLFRIGRALRAVPGIGRGLEAPTPPGGSPKASIIVPAHNEEASIETCARSLAAQDYPDFEVVFVLDRCTDRTREILNQAIEGDDRMRVVEISSCPDDWAGKCNAAGTGAREATGEWLLFVDADTHLHPSLLRAAVGMATERKLDLLSLLSTLSTRRWFERFVQPAASMNLMRMYPIDRVNRDGARRNFANGQFMLFSREMYDRIGGHAAVRDDLLEDIAFARAVRRAGGRGGLFFDDRMLSCTMYESFGAFREGWKRIYIEACKRRPERLRRNALRAAFVGVIDPSVKVATAGLAAVAFTRGDESFRSLAMTAFVVVAASFAVKIGALVWSYRIGGAPLWGALFYPVGAWHVARILRESSSDLENRRPVRWGGREYVLEPAARRTS